MTKNRATGINVKIIHLEVELDDDGEIKAIRRETVRLEKNNVRLSCIFMNKIINLAY